jgi:hypothetical protein
MFFLHGQKVDEMKGADPTGLRQKTQQWALQSNQPVRLLRECVLSVVLSLYFLMFPTDITHLESQKSRIFYFT